MPAESQGNNWKRVNPDKPCPVCKHSDWCSISVDGTLAACRHVEAGCWKSKTDRSGAPVYLHRLANGSTFGQPPPRPPGATVARAEADLLHSVYAALLARLRLSRVHRDALRQRGLADSEIDRRSYRTLPVRGRAGLARDLCEQFSNSGRCRSPGSSRNPARTAHPISPSPELPGC